MHDLTPGLIRDHIACLQRAAADEIAPAEVRARVRAELKAWQTETERHGTARNAPERHGTEAADGH